MANISWAATRYGEIATIDNVNGGIQLYGNGYKNPSYASLPVVNTQVIGISPAQIITTQWGSVTVNSIIEVYPMGLQTPAKPKRYISDITVAAAQTARA